MKRPSLFQWTVLAVMLAGAVPAHAWERHLVPQIAGERGTWSQQTEESRGQGHYKRSKTIQTPRGQRTETQERNFDRESGTLTRQNSITRMDGSSVQKEGTLQRTDDGWTSQRERTGAAGNTVSRDSAFSQLDGNVNATTTRALTGAGGKSLSVERSANTTAAGKAAVSTTVTSQTKQGSRTVQGGSYSTADGRTGQFVQSQQQNADGSSRTIKGIEGQDGRYLVKEVTTSPTGDKTTTFYNQNGSITTNRP